MSFSCIEIENFHLGIFPSKGWHFVPGNVMKELFKSTLKTRIVDIYCKYLKVVINSSMLQNAYSRDFMTLGTCLFLVEHHCNTY